MSEYQYIAFRAVDSPLTDRELAFARKQSTRAEITRWSFQNEYNFGDFRGDTKGLLRHGYDAHLHYANFGVRKIALRLPAGLPFPKRVWSKYIGIGELAWTKDAKGKGGILSLNPFHDAGGIEELWDPGDYMDDVVAIRGHLAKGDLRSLYILWLCAAMDDQSVSPDVVEPPVPGGLAECVESCGALLEFFGLDPLILVAASECAAAAPPQQDHEQQVATWVDGLTESESKRLLQNLLIEDAAIVRSQMIAAIHASEDPFDWPTVASGRSFCDLLDRTETLRAEQDARRQTLRDAVVRREAAKQQRQRLDRMAKMVKDPKKWLRNADELVDARGTHNYEAAAEILADLREAVGGDEGRQITRKHAARLAKKHPTLNRLKSSLRKRGLLE